MPRLNYVEKKVVIVPSHSGWLSMTEVETSNSWCSVRGSTQCFNQWESIVQHMFETSLAANPELVGQQYAFVAFDLAIVEEKHILWFGSFSPILKNVTVSMGVYKLPLILTALKRVA